MPEPTSRKQINPRKVKPILNEGIVLLWPCSSSYTDEELRDELARACRDNDSDRLLDAFDIDHYLSAACSS